MASMVKARPNFYQMLGLKPSATTEEIKQAFARKMSLANAMTAAAEICAAYETLRNPGRRLDYDRTIGLGPKAEPQPRATQWTIAAPQWSGTPFVIPERFKSLGERAAEIARPPEPPMAAPRPDSPADAQPAPKLEAEIERLLEAAPIEDERTAVPGGSSIEWKHTALIAGGLLISVGLVGAWAGSLAGNDVEAAQQDAVTLTVPKAKPPTASSAAMAPAPAPVLTVGEAQPTYVAPRRAEHPRSRPQPAEDRAADVALKHTYYETTAADGTTEIAVADAPAAPTALVAAAGATAATMPLPNSVIARTLHKVGYSCGDVASTTPVDGAPGTFTVTCTSGQSFQARPVRGRYHFRRLRN